MPLSRRSASLGLTLAMAALLLPVGAMAGSPGDMLPDLRMARPSDIRLTYGSTEDGSDRRLLRFSALIMNVGKGPLIVRGKRDCANSSCPKMRTIQRIKQTDGTSRGVASNRAARFDVGDGHNHWHVMRFQRYELFQLDPPPEAPGEAVRGAKTGFCFFDTEARRLDLSGAPQNRVFGEPGCGRSWSTSIRMGLSVGWGDLYGWTLPRQWIDTTGLGHGRFLLCSTANAEGDWLERNHSNNQAWAEIQLFRNNQGADQVRVPSGGRSPCSTQLTDGPTAASDGGTVAAGGTLAAEGANAQQAAFAMPPALTAPADPTVAGGGFLCSIGTTASAGTVAGA